MCTGQEPAFWERRIFAFDGHGTCWRKVLVFPGRVRAYVYLFLFHFTRFISLCGIE